MKKFVARALAAITVCGTALALPPMFPGKPIHLIVAHPPGGSADVQSRAIAEGVIQRVGQSVVVEKLSTAMNETLKTPTEQARFLQMKVELRPNTPQLFDHYIEAEAVKWKEVVRVSGVKLD
ncbi:hypothetical protein [Gemmatimonas sp.]|uniref:hypothetical protein n=1 Tax=Gemmatimonas sp. TaxID=1962908 RepID=UPI00356AFE63